MGLFDKKYCDVCGEKIGLLGNRKLEDGNLCKDCAAKLSPFFSERKSSTVEEIKQQLAYREENQRQIASFRATRIIGDRMKVMVDELGKRFVVTSSSDILKANPDIIPLSDVISCNLDLQVDDTELMKEDAQGKEVSYNPPRFCYSYNFYIEISVNHPWFSQIRFRLNSSDIEIVDEVTGMGAGMGRMMDSRQGMVHPEYNMDYRKYQQMADEIVAVLTGQPTARGVAANVINNMADGQGFVNSVVNGIGAGMAGAGMMQGQAGMQNPNMMQGQAGMQNPNMMQGQAGMQNPNMMQGQAGMQNPNMMQGQAGMQNPNMMQGQAGMQNSNMMQGQAGMQNPNMMQGQAGMQNSNMMQNGSWVCSCGMTNTGRFCQNCGSTQPAARHLRCSNCGWEPTDPTHIPKFCPQCGGSF